MKQFNIFLMTLAVLFAASKDLSALPLPSGIVDIGIFSNTTSGNKLEIRIRPTIAIANGDYSSGIFVIKYLTSYNVSLGLNPTSDFDYDGFLLGTDGGYTYYFFTFTGSNPVDWDINEEVVVALIPITGAGIPGGTGIFELTDDAYATAATFGSAFYQQLSGNGESGDPGGQQGIFYAATTSAPLPVELMSFTAKIQPEQTVKLDWVSALELGLAFYDVEHSTDGANYKPIGKVAGKGTPNGPAVYTLTHPRPAGGNNFYRLKMVDNDGAHEYSPIRIVRFEDVGATFILSPNPTNGPFSLFSSSLETYQEDLSYQIYDVTGKLLEEGLVRDEKLDFDLSGQKSGMYSFVIKSNKEIVKQFQFVLTAN